ncbi:MAG: S8 family serine peptidase, partial [Vicinamibacteria bacterium]
MRRSHFVPFAAALVLAVSLPLSAREPDLSTVSKAAERTAGGARAILVELSDPPVARYDGRISGLPATSPAKTGITLSAASREEVGRYREYLESRQEEFLERVRKRIPDALAGARYRIVFNGVALVVPPGSLRDIASLPGVLRIHPLREYFLTLDASNGVMGAPAFWSALGGDEQAGAGMKIGILDTGIDFSNPMFSDSSLFSPAGFPRGDQSLANGKVIVARHFQSLFDQRDTNVNLGHRTAQDLVGHGSHSAGVAAGAR